MNVQQLSDEEVVELTRSSDQELYEVLVKRYQEKLWRYANYLVSDDEMASDAVQNALIKGFINLKGFNTKQKFSSWIYRITHNEAMNLVKKYHKEVKVDDFTWKVMEAKGENLEDAYIQSLKAAEVTQALQVLPIEYRSPLALFFIENKSYSEISDIMRLPVNTIGTRIRRGKKMIYEKLQKGK